MRLPNRKYPNQPTKASFDPYLTIEKYNGLKVKLEKLTKVDRPKAAQEVAELAHDGDFSENAGYQAAKQALRTINSNILRIENILKKAKIIKKDNSGTVQMGSLVTVEINGRTKQLQILGSSEANPSKNIISYSSPVGSALMNKKVNDIITIKINDKVLEYRIVAVE